MKITELSAQSCKLKNLSNLNVIMGRNGAGKSRYLRTFDRELRRDPKFNIRYISPERAGSFARDGNIITNMENNPEWLRDVRATNQAGNFKAASAVLLLDVETMYNRRLSATPDIRLDLNRTFQTDRLDKINRLLTNVFLELEKSIFAFKSLSGETIAPRDVSSGESEAVSLATEILYFFDTADPNKFNVLLLDEPDVHLHPDLQARLAKLIIEMLDEYKDFRESIAVCIATHSTPFACAISASNYASIGTKSFGNEEITLKRVPNELRKLGPFFGHPLSLTLCDDIAVIVEGEDDERVWQQAARSSCGRIKLFPVLADTVDQQTALENTAVDLLKALYDQPVAFSVRDGDGKVDCPLSHNPPLHRYRLECYAIENLLLTDQCLRVMGSSWEDFVSKARNWLGNSDVHKNKTLVEAVIHSPDRLRHTKIKDVRNLIPSIVNCSKPWEVVVGQAISSIQKGDTGENNMLVNFIGLAAVNALIFNEY